MGKGSKQTVGFFYSKDLAGVLCHKADAITRITCSDEEIWRQDITGNQTINIDAPNVFGGPDREGGVGGVRQVFAYYDDQNVPTYQTVYDGQVDVMFGGEDQEPNAYMQNKIGETISAMRGVVSVVWNRLYIGMNPYLREFKWRVKRTNTGWYNEKSIINSSTLFLTPSVTNWLYKTFPYSDSTNYVDANKSSWNYGQSPFGDKDFSAPSAYDFPTTPATVIPQQVTLWAETSINISDVSQDFFFDCYLDNGIAVWVNGVQVINYYYTYDSYYSTTIPASYFNVGTNRITIKCIDDGYGVRPDNWIWFDLRLKGSSVADADMNPAHIIRECLTNDVWGFGASESSIDDAAFTAMADTLYNESFGISIVWDGSSTINDFIQKICSHINATAPYIDNESGLWTCKLLRDDYDENSLISINESNVTTISDFKRATMIDLVNQVSVTYWDRLQGKNSTLTYENPARVAQQGKVVKHEVTYDGITNAQLAARVAVRDLKMMSSPLASLTLKVKQSVASTLKVGDVFKFSWSDYGIEDAIMRVSKIKKGGVLINYLEVECTEDMFSMPMQAVIPFIPPNESPDKTAIPCDGILIEAPYFELVQRYGQSYVDQELEKNNEAGFVLAACSSTQNAINAALYTNSGAGYSDVGNVNFSPRLKLAAAVDLTDSTLTINDSSVTPLLVVGTYIQVNDELMTIMGFNGTTLTVKRGALDTVPMTHAIDSLVFSTDYYSHLDETEYFDGQDILGKLLPNTGKDILSLSEATALSVTLQSRAFRPYPPANVKIDGNYFPESASGDLILTWSHRNRVQQTSGNIIGWYDNSVTLETGVEYVVELYDGDDVLVSSTNVGSVDTYTLNTSGVNTTNGTVKIYTVRDGLESFMEFEHTMILSFAAPYNVVGTYNSTTTSVDLTWDFDE